MAFVNERPDSPTIMQLSTEIHNEILRAFATGSSVETISEVMNLTADEITVFLTNRTDEVIALKDYYATMQSPVEEEVIDINTKAVYDNGHKRH